MLGVISSRRDCCASCRVGSGRSSKCYIPSISFLYSRYREEGKGGGHTRVVCRTFDKRGKSLTPESRMSIELSRR